MSVKARQIRKEWQSWASDAFGAMNIPNQALNESLVQWFKGLRSGAKDGLSFEVTLLGTSSVLSFFEELLSRSELGMAVLLAGDSDDPQAIILFPSHFGKVVERLTRLECTLCMAPLSGNGTITLDVTKLGSGEGYEVLIAGSGELERVAHLAKELKNEGIIFKGN